MREREFRTGGRSTPRLQQERLLRGVLLDEALVQADGQACLAA